MIVYSFTPMEFEFKRSTCHHVSDHVIHKYKKT